MKKFLVIDIGNTQTKWAVATTGSVGELKETASTKLGLRKIRAPRGIQHAVISSVVPALNQPLRRALRRLKISKITFISYKTDLGIGIRYPEPRTIGADRLANAVAASHLIGSPAVVIDFGTAVTFDVVSRGNYIGGVICPGLRSMTDYLHDQTALLPRISLQEPRHLVGKSTVEAMRAGAVVGYRGLIEGVLKALKKELRASRLPVVATGGYSRLIAGKVPGIRSINPKLTLEGLRLIGLRLKKRDE